VTPDPIYKFIGAKIQARRKKLELKQENLARMLGISRGSLANVETGRQSILVHQLFKFAEKLQLTPLDLLPEQSSGNAESNRTDLPLPADLKSQQKKQVAKLFS
jgi:transcriptional regulator with XRE-family HTH domain